MQKERTYVHGRFLTFIKVKNKNRHGIIYKNYSRRQYKRQ
jgi:hypothetical protein